MGNDGGNCVVFDSATLTPWRGGTRKFDSHEYRDSYRWTSQIDQNRLARSSDGDGSNNYRDSWLVFEGWVVTNGLPNSEYVSGAAARFQRSQANPALVQALYSPYMANGIMTIKFGYHVTGKAGDTVAYAVEYTTKDQRGEFGDGSFYYPNYTVATYTNRIGADLSLDSDYRSCNVCKNYLYDDNGDIIPMRFRIRILEEGTSPDAVLWIDDAYANDCPEGFTTTTILLDKQGGNGGSSSVEAMIDSEMPSISIPTRMGYTFNGYYTSPGGLGTQYYMASGASARTCDMTNPATLYAKWTANTYSVTMDRQGGDGGSSSVTATYDSEMPSISVPVRTGYTFCGYYTSTNDDWTQYYTASGASARNWDRTSATTLFAKWAANTYFISYDYADGTGGETNPSSAVFGTAFRISAPTRQGFHFMGWTVLSGLDSSIAKWGMTSSPETPIETSSSLCVNRESGDVFFKNLTAMDNGSVTLMANWEHDEWPEGMSMSGYGEDFKGGWSIVADTNATDGYVLRSDEIGTSETASIEATVDGPGRLDFDWRISANRGDYAHFYVDGVEKAQITRSTEWGGFSLEIGGDGPHLVRWEYEHRASSVANENAAYLDNIGWHPAMALTIASEMGVPSPAIGIHQHYQDDVIEASVVAPAYDGNTRMACAGWMGTGSAPATGLETNVTFTILEDSSITWLWRTEHRIVLTTQGALQPDFAEMWVEEGKTVVVSYEVMASYAEIILSGDTDGVTLDEATQTLTITANTPRSIVLRTTRSLTLAEALDGEGLAWTTDEDAGWKAQLTVTSDGEDAAVSGPVDADGVSGLETTVSGPGIPAWRWKLVTEDVSGLDVIVDSDFCNPARTYEESGDWSGDSLAFDDNATHTIRFEFWNLGSGESDCAYLDCFLWTPASPIPPLATNAAPETVTNAIASAGFKPFVAATLQDAIGGDAAKYNEFKTWAQAVKDGDGAIAGEAAVVASERAALSYLLGTDTLIADDIESDDVHITGFSIDHGAESCGGEMQFSFEVAIDGVEIGSSGAIASASLKENLKKAIGIEGATRLDGEFSSENIEIVFDAPVDGKARFTATPPTDAGESFFMRAKIK